MTKSKLAVAGLLIAAALTSAAETNVDVRAQRRAYNESVLRRTGGEVVKPGKGYVAVVNRQSLVASAVIEEEIALLAEQSSVEFRLTKEDAKDAAVTVRLVEAADRPSLVAAPENGWAEVNVAALANDLKGKAKDKLLPDRTKKMIARGFVFATGAGTGYSGNILDIATVRELDYLENFVPVDAVDATVRHAGKRGLVPSSKMTYRQACMEGWAPQPTNDVQKAVWDEIHAIPTNPIKIKYNANKQPAK